VIEHCSARHTAHTTTLRFSTDVRMRSVQWLVDEVEHARNYLGQKRVIVEIDSHGGDSHGLDFWLHHCRAWSLDPSFTLATRAVGSAESAAAIMLSYGTPGARTAVPTARLLYHTARVVTAGHEVWTERRLQMQHAHISQFDTRVLEDLVTHLLPARLASRATPNTDTRAELLATYRELWMRDSHISPSEAVFHGLIDRVEDR
jgi:ATP-dependent protease ClpP protease subunit